MNYRLGKPPPSISRRLLTAVLATLLLWVIYAFGASVRDLLTTGVVAVNSTSRGSPRTEVPLTQAWAHLSGLLLLMASFASGLIMALRGFPKSLPLLSSHILAILAFPVGLALWFFSGFLSTLSGTAYLTGFILFIATVAFIDKKFGRTVTTVLLVAFVIGLLFKYSHGA
jgi:hypothetical protein